MEKSHKAGFVNLIGKPNAGKSTLMNQLVGERLSIITSKAQTTRHRIMGIINGEDYQIVYSDTPGIIEPKYELHRSMMRFVEESLEDADVLLVLIEANEPIEKTESVKAVLARVNAACLILINKIDLLEQEQATVKLEAFQAQFPEYQVLPISALHGFNVPELLGLILEKIPEHPPFFAKDELTDKPERFFAAEIIREKIFLNFKQEVPYATEVVIASFREGDDLIKVSAEIIVERQSQKGILIGKGGKMLKKVGTEARKDMEAFFQKQVFLEQYVKVSADWRFNATKLRRFGY